jgi:hypothetical protein
MGTLQTLEFEFAAMQAKKTNYHCMPLPQVKGCIGEEKEEYSSLQSQYSDLIQVDASLIGDAFRPVYDKGLELHLIDAEEQIDQMEEKLNEKLGQFKVNQSRMKIEDLHQDWMAARNAELDPQIREIAEELDYLCDSIDKSFVQDEDDINNVYSYLEMYIDKFSLADLAVIMDVLEQLHYRKEISWFYYIECGLAVSYRLVNNCPKGGWDEVFNKLKAWKQTHHAKTCTYEDKFFSSMSLDIEDAIDFMTKVRALAKKNNVSETVMFYTLMEEHEAEASGLPMEGYSQDLPEEDIEAMMMDFEAI